MRDFHSLDLDNPEFNNNLSSHLKDSDLQINWKLFDFKGNLRTKIDWLESLKGWNQVQGLQAKKKTLLAGIDASHYAKYFGGLSYNSVRSNLSATLQKPVDLDTLAQESNRLTKQALRMFDTQNKNDPHSARLWEVGADA